MPPLVESAGMKIAELAGSVPGAELRGDPGTEILNLAYHTRDVAAGTLFLCVPGFRSDGHEFARDAVERGAAGLVCERALELPATQVIVPSVRAAMAAMAARFYDDPSRRLSVVGITGTNGKTTTAHLIAGLYEAAGRPSGLLGTVSSRVGGRTEPVTLTTPESLDLQRLLARMADAGDAACAMEVSSHALVLGRASAIHFAAVVFTNLSRDHLDFHADLEDYYLAKRGLFLPGEGARHDAVAVVNVSGEWGARLAEECRAVYGRRLWTCAVATAGSGDEDGAAGRADVLGVDAAVEPDGAVFTLRSARTGWKERLRIRLGARFNVENAVTAATAALALGLPPRAIARGLAVTEGVAGRFEAVRRGQPFTVLVDYSHTPDSLENALLAARAVARGRLLVVFGCGGDRDRGKRPLMGAIAARLSDRAFVTSDNPRSEDPEAIIDEILHGVPAELARSVTAEPDRRAAIGMALRDAAADDVVVIAGKGHEQGQTIGTRTLPFDDRAVAAEWLGTLGFASVDPDGGWS
jgi:UDP-N-acetylmuramoyl-L-alanyl-D-glutamate--2,6-diaminopimelate ligase